MPLLHPLQGVHILPGSSKGELGSLGTRLPASPTGVQHIALLLLLSATAHAPQPTCMISLDHLTPSVALLLAQLLRRTGCSACLPHNSDLCMARLSLVGKLTSSKGSSG